jgi:hypothetical protein
LPGTGRPTSRTPHTLRRTYISIALLANGFDVTWVMAQVGDADSKMPIDVYAQLEQRGDRSHGTQFDALLRSAKDRLHGPEKVTKRSQAQALPVNQTSEPTKKRAAESGALQAIPRWQDPDRTRDTRFSEGGNGYVLRTRTPANRGERSE